MNESVLIRIGVEAGRLLAAQDAENEEDEGEECVLSESSFPGGYAEDEIVW